MPDLREYLDRIAYDGPVSPSLDVLHALHRAHILAVPYENLDVQLGRPLTASREAAWEKIVGRRRGGWCYEMNGVFGLALELAGYDVTRVAGGVGRGGAPGMAGNHLVNLVRLPEGFWIADVGLADGPQDPFRLEAHAFSAAGFDFRLEDLGDGAWRLHNHDLGAAPYFDFRPVLADEALLESVCQAIQTHPESPKKLNALVMRHTPSGLLQLRGRVLREVTPEGRVAETLIATAAEWADVVRTRFDLDLPEAASLWPQISARHDTLFAAT
ncbi:arylamine N-acetyltransferase family protein [Phenylobacterium immobile]|uniref:arylamine N-acetyltransferase family protein n=1 Tax=Phenylobacterium immobile TaxID=21 RepID=UPI000A9542AC|nr:arylamine N-acetyltransferase [Phenylobacterium immobile]